MITAHRPSILKRPLRPNGNMANVENMEKEYEKEQARIRSHATWKENTEERMRKSNYGAPAERAAMQQEMAAALEAQIAAQRARADAATASQRDSYPQNHTVPPQDMNRPWTGTTSQLTAQQEARARQRAEKADAEVNRSAATMRAALEHNSRANDIHSAQRALHSEDSYWNRGASSDRWVAPEMRPRSSGGGSAGYAHSQHNAAGAERPAPYTWQEAPRLSPAEVLAKAAAIRSPVVAPYHTHDTERIASGRGSQQQVPAVQTSQRPVSSAPFWTASEDSKSDSAAVRQSAALPKKEYLWSWDT